MDDLTPAQDTPAESEGQTPAVTPDDAPAAESISLDEAKKLRREASSLRARLKAIEDEKLSETEKLKRDYDALTTERDTIRSELRQTRAQEAARGAGARSARAVAALLPSDALDDNRALQRALTELRREEPDLFYSQNGSADGGQGRQPAPDNDMNQAIRRAAGRT